MRPGRILGRLPVPFLVLSGVLAMLFPGCIHRASSPPPQLVVQTTTTGRGWPFGESGGGAVLSLSETATDPGYGWRHDQPVMLGGWDEDPSGATAAARQIRFLNSLWGPAGEIVFYERIGTCCPFEHIGAPLDKGMIDVYTLTWDGMPEPRQLFLDGFRTGPILLPSGLTTRVPPLGAH
jgi:hypothetical protein